MEKSDEILKEFFELNVTVNSTVGTVCSSAHFRSTVDLQMVNDKVFHIQALIFSVGFSVPQEIQKKLSALFGPSTLGGFELLGLK